MEPATAAQICINSPANIIGLVTSVIAGVSLINNLMPAPETISNPVLKVISKITHFIALDIVTAAK